MSSPVPDPPDPGLSSTSSPLPAPALEGAGEGHGGELGPSEEALGPEGAGAGATGGRGGRGVGGGASVDGGAARGLLRPRPDTLRSFPVGAPFEPGPLDPAGARAAGPGGVGGERPCYAIPVERMGEPDLAASVRARAGRL